MNHKQIAESLQRAGFDVFSDRRSYALSRAQDCLSGRTHYVDADTLRCFRARVLSSAVLCDGLFFGMVESASGDSEHRTRIFRGVVFDIFGTVVSRPSIDNAHKTRRAAEKEFRATVDALNPAEYYRGVLTRKADRLADDAAALRKIVGEL